MTRKYIGLSTIVLMTAIVSLYLAPGHQIAEHTDQTLQVGLSPVEALAPNDRAYPQHGHGPKYSAESRSEQAERTATVERENALLREWVEALEGSRKGRAGGDGELANAPQEPQSPVLAKIASYANDVVPEETDGQWAKAIKTEIAQVLERPRLEGISTVSAECRTTTCRLDLAMADAVQAELAEIALISKLSGRFSGTMLFRRLPAPTEAGMRLVVFYSREDHALPSVN